MRVALLTYAYRRLLKWFGSKEELSILFFLSLHGTRYCCFDEEDDESH
jgi:hypothetical protein